jgi:hypothetical protein
MFAEMPLDNRTVDKFAALFALRYPLATSLGHLRAFSSLWNVAAETI